MRACVCACVCNVNVFSACMCITCVHVCESCHVVETRQTQGPLHWTSLPTMGLHHIHTHHTVNKRILAPGPSLNSDPCHCLALHAHPLFRRLLKIVTQRSLVGEITSQVFSRLHGV